MKSLGVWLLSVALAAPVSVMASAPASAAPAPAPTSSATSTADRPAVVESRVIGRSVKGRDIVAWRLGNPRSSKKVLLLGAMHGDERGAVTILRALRDGRPIDGADIWVVPVVNPDGYASNRRQNAHGVDLNRNFGAKWRKIGGATKSGRRAFSEPETRAVRDFVDEIRPTYTVSYHQPLDGIDIRDTGNRAWAQRLAAQVRLPKKAFDCFSKCFGTYSMWFRAQHRKGAVITVEMTRRPSQKYLTRIAPRAILRSLNATR
jgi:protein MpaA